MTDRLTDPDGAMRAYYERRAQEYDDWWRGTGLFARRRRPGWDSEVRTVIGVVAALEPARTLDVACGTGFLTEHLRGELTLLDQSPGMVALAATRVPDARSVVGEAIPLPFADASFERVFTGHFYGHLQADERAAFLREARRVGQEIVVVDSGGGVREEWQERVLGDGSRTRVYKRWFTGASLAGELGGGDVLHDGEYFVVVRT